MLIEFSVANFRSIRERQTFSLVKAKGDELIESNVFKVQAPAEYQLLRSAALYGPNAGGKTSLLLAMKVMKRIVLRSAIDTQHGDKLSVTPFRLSSATLEAPSEFEITFIAGQIRYQYGFTATTERIHEEWLLTYPKGRPQWWIGRSWNEKEKRYNWKPCPNLAGKKDIWKKSTRDNALFLSTAVQLNSEQLKPVYDWFNTTLRITNTGDWGLKFSASQCKHNEKEKQSVIKFLQVADLHIKDIALEEIPFSPNQIPDDIPTHLRTIIASDFKDTQILDIKMIHQSIEGTEVAFDLEDESNGTQKLFAFAGPWIDCLRNGYVLFIDELHDKLHPKLVLFLVQLFHNSVTNPKNAQLIFTTHETSILNQEVFRRDQIWFCEKDSQQATTVYPLTDFSPRKDRENLELSYLSGRYGALPYIRPLRKPI